MKTLYKIIHNEKEFYVFAKNYGELLKKFNLKNINKVECKPNLTLIYLNSWKEIKMTRFYLVSSVFLIGLASTLFTYNHVSQKQFQSTLEIERLKINQPLEMFKASVLNSSAVKTAAFQMYDQCMKEASEKYDSSWESECKRRKLGENCALPIDGANLYHKRWQSDRDECKVRFDAALK